MEAYSLFELNEFIRRVLALNFAETLWVRGEIAQCNQSRGHYFLYLVEKGNSGEEIIAQAEAVLWQRSYRQLLKKKGIEINQILQEGIEVQLLVRVDFHERYGLKYIIEDLDLTFTLGKLELKRRETIRTLQSQQLLNKNATLPLPPVLQRIAILSSENAAGYQDYLAHLHGNEFGYRFDNQLFPTAMQGTFVEKEMLAQLKKIKRQQVWFDAVVIIRGGGARLDLSAFDSLELCKAVAKFPLPIFTGIGHDVDETVLDLVAFQALKTPTAVADYLIQHTLNFESTVVQLGLQIKQIVHFYLQSQNGNLQQLEQTLKFTTQRQLQSTRQMLSYIETEIPRLVKQKTQQAHYQLNNLNSLIQLLSPEATLRRGFSLTMKDGKAVNSSQLLNKGERLTTYFQDGEIESEII